MRQLLACLLLPAAFAALTAPVRGADLVWSVETSRLDRSALDRLESRADVTDFAELGDRLVVQGKAEIAFELRGAGLSCTPVPGLDSLRGLYLVLSKHHGVESILEGRARIVARSGPFFVIRVSEPGLLRLRAEEDHRLRIVPLGRRMVVFRSPAHLEKVDPADPAVTPLVNGIDRASLEATLKKLIAFGTRYTFSPGIEQASTWAVEIFRSLGYDAKIVRYAYRGKQLPNVVAELKGTVRPGELYVVGAHLDSIAWDSMASAPGADDNGSGSAGVLEMARVLSGKRAAATIRFVLFSGEEQGLHGSAGYVRQLAQAGELSKVKAMLNLDMIAFDPTAPIDVMLEGRAISHAFSDRLQAHAAAHAPAMKVYRTDNAWGSDHVSFLDAKVPATLTIEYEYDGNGNEHSPKDVFGICNLDLAVAILRMDVGALAELAGVESQESE